MPRRINAVSAAAKAFLDHRLHDPVAVDLEMSAEEVTINRLTIVFDALCELVELQGENESNELGELIRHMLQAVLQTPETVAGAGL